MGWQLLGRVVTRLLMTVPQGLLILQPRRILGASVCCKVAHELEAGSGQAHQVEELKVSAKDGGKHSSTAQLMSDLYVHCPGGSTTAASPATMS